MDLDDIKSILIEVYNIEVDMEMAYEEGWKDAIREVWYELFGEEIQYA